MTTMTDSAAGVGAAGAEPAPLRLFGSRGRHRRPRPRKVLLAAGGFALAAGALSLVRLTPESGFPGGLGAGPAEAEPRLDDPDTGMGTGTDRATNAAATVGTVPKVSPSATSALGGASATPTAGPSGVPLPSATTVLPSAPAGLTTPPAAIATTIPDSPNTPAPAPTHPAPATSNPAPQPAPSQPSASPTPQPSQPGGVCVPVIGLCVGPLGR